VIGGGDRARQRQHQRAGVLGDADAVRAGRVDDQDAAELAAATSTLSTPVPARDDRRPGAASISAASTWSRCGPAGRPHLRGRRPESGVRPERASTTQPASADQFQRGGGQFISYDDLQRSSLKAQRLRLRSLSADR
jgi:hypothetical protein